MAPDNATFFDHGRAFIADITGDPAALSLGPVITARELLLLAYESSPRPSGSPRPPAPQAAALPSFDRSPKGIERYVNGLCVMAAGAAAWGLEEPDPSEYSGEVGPALADAAMWCGIVKALWLTSPGFSESALSYLDGAIDLWTQAGGVTKVSRCLAERGEVSGLSGDRSAAAAYYERAAGSEPRTWRADLFAQRANQWRSSAAESIEGGWFTREPAGPGDPGVVTALAGHRHLGSYLTEP